MRRLDLHKNDFIYIQYLLKEKIEDIALEISFYEPNNMNQRYFIDEIIVLCKKFDIDFWQYVNDFCSDHEGKRLKAIYEGKHFLDFTENYKMPSEVERAKRFLKIIKG